MSTADPVEDAPVSAPPSVDELGRQALRVAVRGIRADDAKRIYEAARDDAEVVFAAARRHGTKQQAVMLPDGTDGGLISIHKGSQTARVDENELLLLVATTVPAEVVEYVRPEALHDEQVLELLRKHLPGMVARRIRPGYRQQLQAELEEHDGTVANTKTGEREQVAEITTHDPTGKFTYRPDKAKANALRAAVEAGLITEDGEIVAAPARAPMRQQDPDNDHRFEQAGTDGYEL